MCGRYTLVAFDEQLAAEFDLIVEKPLRYQRYNIAPTQLAPVIRVDESGIRRIDELRWGLIPHWSKDAKIASRTINARSEEAAGKPAFRTPFKRQRCLVPASGFYEWKVIPGGTPKKPAKQPYCIRRRDEHLFAFAGLWDRWHAPEGEVVETFTILTGQPNEAVRPLHDRMPVIIARQNYDHWLDRNVNNPEEISALLSTCPSDQLTTYAISTRVNNPALDDPTCLEAMA